MTFLITAFAVGGFGATTAAAVTGAISLSTAATVLAGGAAIFGAVQSIQAGETAARNADFQRDQLLVEGKISAANAKKQENAARETLLQTLATTNAAAASSGIQLTSPTVESGREAAQRQANRELSTVQTSEQIASAGRRAKAAKLRIDATAAKRSGRRDAIIGLTQFGARELRR